MEEQVPATPTISVGDIIINVFASPAEAFEGIRTSPTRASVWLIPIILLMLLGSGFTWMIFTNEGLHNQMMDSQRERLQERVQAGKMTQDQADQAMQGMEKGSGIFIAIGIVITVVMITIAFFLAGLVFWLTGRFGLKAAAGYGKYLELWGATQWIGILGLIVMMLLAMTYSSIYASPSAALTVLDHYNQQNSMHRLLSSLNVFTIWQMIVTGIGLSKFSGKSAGTGIGVAIGLWIVWVIISVYVFAALGLS